MASKKKVEHCLSKKDNAKGRNLFPDHTGFLAFFDFDIFENVFPYKKVKINIFIIFFLVVRREILFFDDFENSNILDLFIQSRLLRRGISLNFLTREAVCQIFNE